MTKDELEQCVTKYEKDLFSFCRYLTGNREDANDLFQDTFLTFLKKHQKIDESKNVKGYLLSIALSLNKNHVRKKAWRNRIAPTETVPGNEAVSEMVEEDTPLTKVLETERMNMIREAVRQLPEKYKIVILLFYMEEQTVAQIASVLGIPQGTVLSRLYQARKILKKKLLENEMDNIQNGGFL